MIFRKVSAKTGKDVLSSFQNIIMELQRGTAKGSGSMDDDPETKFEN